MLKTRHRSAWRCGAAIAALAIASSATAATQNPPASTTNVPSPQDPVGVSNENKGSANEQIVITGTLLRRTNTETPSPVTILSQESLIRGGLTNVNDAVRS